MVGWGEQFVKYCEIVSDNRNPIFFALPHPYRLKKKNAETGLPCSSFHVCFTPQRHGFASKILI